jgi:hypothetical protein
MNDEFKPQNNYLILTSNRPQEGTIEIPDSAREEGAPSGTILFAQHAKVYQIGTVVFYDGTKAYRLRTAKGDYIAVKEEDVICTMDAEA